MASTAVSGIGAAFNRYSGSAWVALAEVSNISGPSKSRETIDVTSFDSTGGYREFIGSLRDGGEVSLNMNFTAAAYEIMNDDFEDDDLQQYQIVLPDSAATTFEFSGLVTGLPLEVPLDDKITANVTIKVSGITELNLS